MAIGDGARGVPKGAAVTVRDVRALRVKLLNHVALSDHIGGHNDTILSELDAIGSTDSDKRSLLARTLELLHEIATAAGAKSSVRWRAAKTITETITELTKDRTNARVSASKLAQQNVEHIDKVKLKQRELDIAEGMGGQSSAPNRALADLSDDELKGMLTHGNHAALDEEIAIEDADAEADAG